MRIEAISKKKGKVEEKDMDEAEEMKESKEEESKTEDGDKLDEKPKTVRFVGCCKFQGS